MTKQIYELTEEGLSKLRSELEELKLVARPANIIALQEARAQGDLSENADYDAARDEQTRIEQRITEIENIIKNHKIIRKDNRDGVSIGKTIKIFNRKLNKEATYIIVGTIEANPFENKISNECPFGVAVLGALVGDVVTVKSEQGISYEVEILTIE